MTITVDTVALRAFSPAEAAALSDDDLIAEQRAFASARRLLDAGAAAVAAEIAHRSRRELGYEGLAVARGARTPEALIAQVTGLSDADARTLVRVGGMVSDPPPWLSSVGSAVARGDLSMDAAEAIRSGLGAPGLGVSAEHLAAAATSLVAAAPAVTLQRLAALAREARDALEERRDRRYLHLTPLADGMTRVSGLLDPESAAIVVGAVNAITSPRRGGPRFVDPSHAPVSSVDDARTIPQLMADALVDIVLLATRTAGSPESAKLFGKRRVAVRVHVAQRDLHSGDGFARIEGQSGSVSVGTAQRMACESGIVPVMFDSAGQVVNVGRDQRFHTARQRIGIAARDGGCRVRGCERPPDWCEIHHTREWDADHGHTSIEDGISLCRHHHMLVHNRGWHIERGCADITGAVEYWMHGPHGERIPMPANNPLLGRVL